MNRHHKAFHSDEIVHCEKCGIRSKNGVEAEKHKQANHIGIKYTCNQCDFESEILKEIDTHHQNEKHQGMKFQCRFCKYKASCRGNLKIHRQAMHDGQTYKCDECEFTASTRRTVGWHKKAKHVKNVS